MSYGLAYTPYNTNLFLNNSSSIPINPNAQAFITAANITDPVQQNAINLLVSGLIADNLWDKMLAIYPFVGGVAFSHKFNLKDPRDLDVAYRLSFIGGWTHSATGAKPNGVNAYADTFLIPSSVLDCSSASYYSRTSTVENGTANNNGVVIGTRSDNDTTVNNTLMLRLKTNPDNFNDYMNTRTGISTNNFARVVDPSGLGFFAGNLDATSAKIYKNGINVSATFISYARSTPNRVVYIGCMNNKGSAAEYSLKESAFAHIGNDLTDTEIAQLYDRVQHFQEDLSRQV
jgi:hypothetical protein